MNDVRTIDASHIEAWVTQMSTAFHFDVAAGYPEYVLSTIDLDRSWASFDGDRVVGTLRSFATALTVPGPREVPAAALTNVTVAATHRRQGRLSAMIASDLRASADRGEVVGILIASEYPIYGRFGYGPAVEGARYAVRSLEARFRDAPSGEVELSDRATVRREAPPLYDRFRRGQPGSIERFAHWWDRTLQQVEVPGAKPPTGQVALYRSASGELEGYVSYEAKMGWDDMRPEGVLTIRELVANTPDAYRALWSFCCGIDLLTSIEAAQRPTDEVLPFLLENGRAVKLTSRFDFVWVRVLDVARALAARTYAAPGRLVIEVVDPMGFATGRFLLEGGPDGASCAPTSERPELTVGVDALGSVYLGGVALRRLEAAGRVDEHRPGAVAAADAMFLTPRAPWCNTWF